MKRNIDRVVLNRVIFEPKAYTLDQLQEAYDSFDKESKPSVGGLINYLRELYDKQGSK